MDVSLELLAAYRAATRIADLEPLNSRPCWCRVVRARCGRYDRGHGVYPGDERDYNVGDHMRLWRSRSLGEVVMTTEPYSADLAAARHWAALRGMIVEARPDSPHAPGEGGTTLLLWRRGLAPGAEEALHCTCCNATYSPSKRRRGASCNSNSESSLRFRGHDVDDYYPCPGEVWPRIEAPESCWSRAVDVRDLIGASLRAPALGGANG